MITETVCPFCGSKCTIDLKQTEFIVVHTFSSEIEKRDYIVRCDKCGKDFLYPHTITLSKRNGP